MTGAIEPQQFDDVVLRVGRAEQRALDRLRRRVVTVGVTDEGAAEAVLTVDGDVLAAASYPTYDLNDYYDKYDELISNPRNPLWSRFAMGTYAPGSTFKPVVASASLEEGTISADTIFNCGGRMKYRGQPFKCLRGNAHGSEKLEHRPPAKTR